MTSRADSNEKGWLEEGDTLHFVYIRLATLVAIDFEHACPIHDKGNAVGRVREEPEFGDLESLRPQAKRHLHL